MDDVTPNIARQRLAEMARTGYAFDDQYETHACASLLRTVENLARRDGLSGEDKYALLAYHLADVAQHAYKALLDQASRRPPMKIEDYEAAMAEAVARLPKTNTGD